MAGVVFDSTYLIDLFNPRLHGDKRVALDFFTNPRTLENWEQGQAKPNAEAALLIRMVAQFPDMVQRLQGV